MTIYVIFLCVVGNPQGDLCQPMPSPSSAIQAMSAAELNATWPGTVGAFKGEPYYGSLTTCQEGMRLWVRSRYQTPGSIDSAGRLFTDSHDYFTCWHRRISVWSSN